MGKTKIKTIDDSSPTEEKVNKEPKKKFGRQDDLVAKINAELGDVEGKSEDKKKTPTTSPVIASTSTTLSVNSAKQSDSEKEIATATPDGGPRNDEAKKTKKPGKAKPRSKKYQEISKDLDRSKIYPLPEAVDMVKKLSYSKFNATIEAHINTVQTGLRGLVSLPYASAKLLRILVFPSSPLKIEGVDIGDDSTIEEINQGKVNFDLIIVTPQWMPKLAKIARILGPRGLMPNPKNGTIVSNEGLGKAVNSFQSGKTEYKTEPKAPVIHLGMGKLDQPTEELTANVKILIQTLGKTKVKKISLSPTMGPSVKVDLASI